MAETIARNIAPWSEYDSCGLAAGFGAQMSSGARAAMKQMGFDGTKHASKPISEELLNWAEIILTMTPTHKTIILKILESKELTEVSVYTIGEYAGETAEIFDPYGQSNEIYALCALEIRRLLEAAFGDKKCETLKI